MYPPPNAAAAAAREGMPNYPRKQNIIFFTSLHPMSSARIIFTTNPYAIRYPPVCYLLSTHKLFTTRPYALYNLPVCVIYYPHNIHNILRIRNVFVSDGDALKIENVILIFIILSLWMFFFDYIFLFFLAGDSKFQRGNEESTPGSLHQGIYYQSSKPLAKTAIVSCLFLFITSFIFFYRKIIIWTFKDFFLIRCYYISGLPQSGKSMGGN